MPVQDFKDLMAVEEILEKEIKTEMQKIIDSGSFSPGQTKILGDAVHLMLRMKEYKEWMESHKVLEAMIGKYSGK